MELKGSGNEHKANGHDGDPGDPVGWRGAMHGRGGDAGDNGRVYRGRTKIEDFPKGMSEPKVVIEGSRNDVFEGSMTYKIKGAGAYLTLVEAMSPAR